MIVNGGKVILQQQQLAYLATCYWKLFTSNTTISATTTWSDLTEAAFTGYTPFLAGAWTTAALVGGKGKSTPSTLPTFLNSSGAGQTVYGWALVDPAGTSLVAAYNFGAATIPDLGLLGLNPSITDDQE